MLTNVLFYILHHNNYACLNNYTGEKVVRLLYMPVQRYFGEPFVSRSRMTLSTAVLYVSGTDYVSQGSPGIYADPDSRLDIGVIYSMVLNKDIHVSVPHFRLVINTLDQVS